MCAGYIDLCQVSFRAVGPSSISLGKVSAIMHPPAFCAQKTTDRNYFCHGQHIVQGEIVAFGKQLLKARQSQFHALRIALYPHMKIHETPHFSDQFMMMLLQ